MVAESQSDYLIAVKIGAVPFCSQKSKSKI